MNVFDFDNTIYDGDCNTEFFFFILKKYPKLRLYLPKLCVFGVLFSLHLCSRDKFKEIFFQTYVPFIDISSEVSLFWLHNKQKIKKRYAEMKQNNDVIISASPRFLLVPICTELSINLISTEVDTKTGQIIGKNCRGQEKVNRFLKEFPNTKIDQFYTDSFSDTPMARMSKKAFLVKGDNIQRFFIQTHYKARKVNEEKKIKRKDGFKALTTLWKRWRKNN